MVLPEPTRFEITDPELTITGPNLRPAPLAKQSLITSKKSSGRREKNIDPDKVENQKHRRRKLFKKTGNDIIFSVFV